ncbi:MULTISPECIES: DUF2254 domain-containing protein [Sporosarcina]|uniref:DUF2254 domain-containing protein n=1 Tax=Sporosarcina TaxID=1569 RepID=UPI0006935DC1|nr:MULTISPECIES: DUF2254 domain-containing protein [Sporosarcina]WJY26907.1 DUF2254 domain-containing protein [Sporosarcina sp. 0.2-SM1T-5]
MVPRLILKLRSSIWFIPGLYAVLASLLALGMVLVDTTFNTQVKGFIPEYLRTSVDLAQTILGTISGALLTMTTITFSTIMVVLTMYSSQFSPRTLQNFLNAPSTQRVLGMFMGGFIYSILSLLFMRKQSITHEVVSATVAVLLAVVCLAFFAYFIHKVGRAVQVSRLIRNLADDVLETIDETMRAVEEEAVVTLPEKPPLAAAYSSVTEFRNGTYGYIQSIQIRELADWAAEQEAVIDILTPIGTFVGTESMIAAVYHDSRLPDFEPARKFTVGEERSTLQDVEYGIEKIAEIGLRALSPGINDPNTAVRCIHTLGEVLERATHLPGGFRVRYAEGNKPCLILPQASLADHLYAAFSQMSFYGRQDAAVLHAMLDALLYIARSRRSSHETLNEVRRIGEYVWNRFDHTGLEPLDSERLADKQQSLRALTADGPHTSLSDGHPIG